MNRQEVLSIFYLSDNFQTVDQHFACQLLHTNILCYAIVIKYDS